MKEIMEFDYGDDAVFRESVPDGTFLDRECCVVGITKVESESQIPFFGYPLGTILYTVEFGDGSDKLVPENALRPVRA
jgi:hypothetical protein